MTLEASLRTSEPAFHPHRVVVLALDGLLPFELGIPHRIFGRPRDAEGRRLYEVVTCSVRPPGPVETDADFAIHVAHGPEALATADTVIVPASYELGPLYEEGRLTGELAAALAHIRPGTRLASICNGVYVLAAAGYLDGRPATTHWANAEHFQRLFPRIKDDVDDALAYELVRACALCACSRRIQAHLRIRGSDSWPGTAS